MKQANFVLIDTRNSENVTRFYVETEKEVRKFLGIQFYDFFDGKIPEKFQEIFDVLETGEKGKGTFLENASKLCSALKGLYPMMEYGNPVFLATEIRQVRRGEIYI